MILLIELFLVYFQIGLFAFGGGYAAMPLIQNLVVEGKGWLTMAEYADLTTIAEMTPGSIIINSATFVGQKMAGLPGALICTPHKDQSNYQKSYLVTQISDCQHKFIQNWNTKIFQPIQDLHTLTSLLLFVIIHFSFLIVKFL
jgi:hypothetical protein